MSQRDLARRKQDSSEDATSQPAQYTTEPWRIVETSEDEWVLTGESPLHGYREIATVPRAVSDAEQQANARLIVQAPAMHRAAVRLSCAWGTEDASEAMEELALILSKAVRS